MRDGPEDSRTGCRQEEDDSGIANNIKEVETIWKNQEKQSRSNGGKAK
jgi:hypothetical protein